MMSTSVNSSYARITCRNSMRDCPRAAGAERGNPAPKAIRAPTTTSRMGTTVDATAPESRSARSSTQQRALEGVEPDATEIEGALVEALEREGRAVTLLRGIPNLLPDALPNLV